MAEFGSDAERQGAADNSLEAYKVIFQSFLSLIFCLLLIKGHVYTCRLQWKWQRGVYHQRIWLDLAWL